MCRKEGVVNHHHFNKTSFLNFFYARCRPPHPRLAPYTPEVETPAPQHTRTDRTSQAAVQAAPDASQTMQGKAHTPGRWTRCTGLHKIPNRPRRADRTGGVGGCSACMLHTQRFYVLVRLILNILLTCTFNHV